MGIHTYVSNDCLNHTPIPRPREPDELFLSGPLDKIAICLRRPNNPQFRNHGRPAQAKSRCRESLPTGLSTDSVDNFSRHIIRDARGWS
jgi:hypothetical protein